MVPEEVAEGLARKLDLYSRIRPENYSEERRKFMEAVEVGEEYDPSFRYPGFEADEVEDLLDEMEREVEGDMERSMFESMRTRKEVIGSIGSESITKTSRDLFGFPDESVIERAREMFETPSREQKSVRAGTLVEAFEHLFDILDIDYGAGTSDNSIVYNDPARREIVVPQGKEYGEVQARRVLVHESTHAVRTYNGIESGEVPLIHGTSGYETAEEGLATFNEREVGVFEDSLPRITSRVIAVAEFERGFHALFSSMRELGLDRPTSFIRAYRVKRGLEDTSGPGGFIKDHIYFAGLLGLEEEPSLAESLYVGKVGFDIPGTLDLDPSVTREEHLDAYGEASHDL